MRGDVETQWWFIFHTPRVMEISLIFNNKHHLRSFHKLHTKFRSVLRVDVIVLGLQFPCIPDNSILGVGNYRTQSSWFADWASVTVPCTVTMPQPANQVCRVLGPILRAGYQNIMQMLLRCMFLIIILVVKSSREYAELSCYAQGYYLVGSLFGM